MVQVIGEIILIVKWEINSIIDYLKQLAYIQNLSSWQDYDQVSYAYIDTQMKLGDSHVKGN